MSVTFKFKITVIGDGAVGKTSLIMKYTSGHFDKNYIKTLGAQFSKHDETIEEDAVKLILWDIAGQDDLSFLRPGFYRDSKAAIIVYSLEDNELGKTSFKHIANWHEDLRHFCGDIPVVVFANKKDLVDEESIDLTNLEKLVNKRNFLGYYLTSAKTGEGVREAFKAIVRNLHKKYKQLSLSM